MFKPKSLVSTIATAALILGIAAASAQTPPAQPAQPAPPAAPEGAPQRGPGGPGGPGGWRGPGMMGPGMMGSGMMLGPGMWGRGGLGRMCGPQAAGLGGWRADQIERAVKPNETQKAALDKLREASSKASEIIAGACPTEWPLTSTGRLEMMEKRMTAMLQAITTMRPAFDAFYATLNDEQKARLDSIGPGGRWGGRGPWRWRER